MSDMLKMDIVCDHGSPLEYFCGDCSYQAAGVLQEALAACRGERDMAVNQRDGARANARAANSECAATMRDLGYRNAEAAALRTERDRLREALERIGATEARSYDSPFDGASSNGSREVCVACNLSVATCASWPDSKCVGRIARAALHPPTEPAT